MSNAGLIVGEKYAIVVDSLTNENMARSFIRKIREVTNKPLRFLLNTHGDADHIWTNHLFGATTICHENCRDDTMRAHPEIYSVLFPELNFSGAKITPQDITINKRMKIYMETREIEVSIQVWPTPQGISLFICQKRKLYFVEIFFFQVNALLLQCLVASQVALKP